MVGFTELVHDTSLKYDIGTSCVLVTFVMICVNAVDLLVKIFFTAKMAYRKQRVKRNMKKNSEQKYKELTPLVTK